MEIIIDNLLGVIGEDLAKEPETPVNGELLFKWEDDLRFARRLAEMNLEDCHDELQCHQDLLARCLDWNQLEQITGSVIENLIQINPPKVEKRQHLSLEKRLSLGRFLRI